MVTVEPLGTLAQPETLLYPVPGPWRKFTLPVVVPVVAVAEEPELLLPVLLLPVFQPVFQLLPGLLPELLLLPALLLVKVTLRYLALR